MPVLVSSTWEMVVRLCQLYHCSNIHHSGSHQVVGYFVIDVYVDALFCVLCMKSMEPLPWLGPPKSTIFFLNPYPCFFFFVSPLNGSEVCILQTATAMSIWIFVCFPFFFLLHFIYQLRRISMTWVSHDLIAC